MVTFRIPVAGLFGSAASHRGMAFVSRRVLKKTVGESKSDRFRRKFVWPGVPGTAHVQG
jgi:hypothetical protein